MFGWLAFSDTIFLHKVRVELPPAHRLPLEGVPKGLIGCLLPPAWLALEIQALRGLAGSMQQHYVWMHVLVEPGYTEKMIGYPDE